MVQPSCVPVKDDCDSEKGAGGTGIALGTMALPNSSCASNEYTVEGNWKESAHVEEVIRPALVVQQSFNCLPENACVWTEGSISAQSVGSLTHGQRVLCYDRLAENVCHDEVQKVSFHSCDTDDGWVSILLEDGTEQQLSTFHPLWPRGLHQREEPVFASDLTPGSHSLVVMKVMPVLVTRVTKVNKVPRPRVVVKLEDHQRYEIFVTHKVTPTSTFVAVGSRQRVREAALMGQGAGLSVASDASSSINGGSRNAVDMAELLTHLNSVDAIGDILPASMFVWTEGSITAQPAGSVQAGHRLLCYDRFASHICYAAVHEVAVQSSDQGETWVSVSLADGTQQDLTSYCCVTPKVLNFQTHTWEEALQPATAQSLHPGLHSLVVIKTVPVPVTRVTKIVGSCKNVAVTLKHPHRCDLLVSNHVHGESMLAVGSVPPCVSSSSSVNSSRTGISSVSQNSFPITSSDSTQSTGSAEVLIAGLTTRRSELNRSGPKETIWSDKIGLQQVILMKKNHLRSIGSLAHAFGYCSVCMFYKRHEKGHFALPCKCDFLCDRCHQDHS